MQILITNLSNAAGRFWDSEQLKQKTKDKKPKTKTKNPDNCRGLLILRFGNRRSRRLSGDDDQSSPRDREVRLRLELEQ